MPERVVTDSNGRKYITNEPLLHARTYTQAELDAAVAAEREQWIGGVRVRIPTETMEQEFTAQRRMGVAQERKRVEQLCEAAMHEAKQDFNAKAVDLLGRLLARVRA